MFWIWAVSRYRWWRWSKRPAGQSKKSQSGENSPHSENPKAVGNRRAPNGIKTMDPNQLRLDLIERICRLPSDCLGEAAHVLSRLEAPSLHFSPESKPLISGKDWPHAPLHRLSERERTW
jgi:hypothetical protein